MKSKFGQIRRTIAMLAGSPCQPVDVRYSLNWLGGSTPYLALNAARADSSCLISVATLASMTRVRALMYAGTASPARIPMITGIASNPQITELSGKGRNEYAFRISASDSAMMNALGIYLADKKPFKTVAIVAEDSDFGRGGADAFKAAVVPKAKLEVVSTDIHPQNTPDFTSILTRLQQRRPDAVATFQLGGDSLNFLRQAMQLGVRIPFTGRIELGGRNMPIIEAGGLEKSISAWQYSALADSPQNKAFAEKIKAKHNAEPYLQTWAGYECIRVLAEAIKKAGSTDGEKIKNALKGMTFTNVMGKTVTFDEYNQAGHWVALHTVLNRKVALADMVEVK